MQLLLFFFALQEVTIEEFEIWNCAWVPVLAKSRHLMTEFTLVV